MGNGSLVIPSLEGDLCRKMESLEKLMFAVCEQSTENPRREAAHMVLALRKEQGASLDSIWLMRFTKAPSASQANHHNG